MERPGADIDEGIATLRRALAEAGDAVGRRGGRSLAGVADRLTATARHATDRPDDVALLLAARRAPPSPTADRTTARRLRRTPAPVPCPMPRPPVGRVAPGDGLA